MVYQTIGGERKTIPATYLLADNQIKFQIGSFDRNASLVIDPVLVYTAMWGGSSGSLAWAMALDSANNVYVTGYTWSTNFPVENPFQSTWPGGGDTVFVSKLNATGTALLYSSYLGELGEASGIAVDTAGRAYVVGTSRAGLPVKNAYQATGEGATAFLTAFGPAGNTLVYSTYFGRDPGQANAVTTDAGGNAYMIGSVNISPGGGHFVAKFNEAGVLQYSKFFGNDIPLYLSGIAVDASGSAYIAGTADSHYPATPHAYQSSCPTGSNHASAIVSKLSPAGDSVIYTARLGCSANTAAYGIVLDSSGSAYIAGSTGSGFPTSTNALQRTFRGGFSDGFVAKLNAAGSGLVWSTYLGGWGNEIITSIALDQYRNVYVGGDTSSPNFPLKGSLFTSVSGKQQKFVTTLSGNLGSIAYYSTYLGTGSYDDTHVGIAVDKALNVYVESTSSNNEMLPTPGAFSKCPVTSGCLLVSKLVIMDDIALGVSASAGTVTHGGNLTYTIAVTSKGPDFGYDVRISDPLPVGTTFVSYDAGGGTCTAPAVGGTGTLSCEVLRLEKADTYTVKLTVNVNAVAGTKISNTATSVSNMQDFVPGNNAGTLTTMVN